MNLVKISSSKPYKAVSDDAIRLFEHLVSRREKIDLTYSHKAVERKLEGARVTGISQGSDECFLQLLDSGIELLIRLDAITSVNGKPIV